LKVNYCYLKTSCAATIYAVSKLRNKQMNTWKQQKLNMA